MIWTVENLSAVFSAGFLLRIWTHKPLRQAEGRDFDASYFSSITGHNQWDLMIDFGGGDSVLIKHQTNSYNQIESFVFDDQTLAWDDIFAIF